MHTPLIDSYPTFETVQIRLPGYIRGLPQLLVYNGCIVNCAFKVTNVFENTSLSQTASFVGPWYTPNSNSGGRESDSVGS